MLLCCGIRFFAAEKIILPQKNKLYRCLEFGFCPHCGVRVSRFIEQEFNYDINIKELRGIKALRAYEKALKQNEQHLKAVFFGSKSAENYFYGDFIKTNRKDEHNQPIYIQVRKNFNNKSEVLGDVITHYSTI